MNGQVGRALFHWRPSWNCAERGPTFKAPPRADLALPRFRDACGLHGGTNL